MTTFDILLICTLVLNASLVAGLVWAFDHPRMLPHRLPGFIPMRVDRWRQTRTVALIGTLSLGVTLTMVYGLGSWLLTAEHRSPATVVLEGLGILVLYDFSYYFLHRSLHHPRLMRFIHRTHHKARFPTALESLFQHPLELLSGLGLLGICTWVVGPVSPYAFLGAFFVYSMTNIFIHSGLSFPYSILAPVNFLTKKHYVHHKEFLANYASMSPLPDIIFGTSRSFKQATRPPQAQKPKETSHSLSGA